MGIALYIIIISFITTVDLTFFTAFIYINWIKRKSLIFEFPSWENTKKTKWWVVLWSLLIIVNVLVFHIPLLSSAMNFEDKCKVGFIVSLAYSLVLLVSYKLYKKMIRDDEKKKGNMTRYYTRPRTIKKTNHNKTKTKIFNKFTTSFLIYIICALTSLIIIILSKVRVEPFILLSGYFMLTIMFVNITYMLFYNYLYKPNEDIFGEMISKKIKTSGKQIIDSLINKGGFKEIGGKSILVKGSNFNGQNYNKYVFISDYADFDLILEKFLRIKETLDEENKNEWYVALIIMVLNEKIDIPTELYKENNICEHEYTNITFDIKDKLFKYIIYDTNNSTMYYLKNSSTLKSKDASEYIDKEFVNTISNV